MHNTFILNLVHYLVVLFMSILSRRNVVALFITFLLVAILASSTTAKETYAETITALTTITQTPDSDLEMVSNTTAIMNVSMIKLEAQSQNTSITTITLSTTITMTNILIHTTTLTLMMTINRGVAESQVAVFVVVIGAISIIVGYLVGYKSAIGKQQEGVLKAQKRGKSVT